MRGTCPPGDEAGSARLSILRLPLLLLVVLVASIGNAFAADDIDKALQRLGLPSLNSQGADRPVDVHSVLLTRLDESRRTIGRCQAFLRTHFKNTTVDALLKGIPQRPGQPGAVTEEMFEKISRAAGGAKGISRRDLDLCVRMIDVPIGGRTTYVRSLEQIDRALYKCTKVLGVGVPSQAAVQVLATLQRQPGSPTYTTSGTLAALDRAFGRPTGLTRLDLDTCAAAYDVDTGLLERLQVDGGLGQGCPSGETYCQGTEVGYICCGGSMPICAQSCDEDGDCEPYCQPSLSCFPGDATVVMEDGSSRPMADVRIGDRVQVARADGSIGFEDVYLLTHKDEAVTQTYLRLTLDSGDTLVLSPRHFIPRADSEAAAWQERRVVGANEIRTGDQVWHLASGGDMQVARVIAVGAEAATGAFNPLTMNGTIVVNGVVASAHSNWFLDGYLPAGVQATVYQVMFAPVRGLYAVIGPQWSRTIAEDWGVVDAVRDGTTSLVAVMAWIGGGLLLLAVIVIVPVRVRRRRAVAR